jgi:hypothetical protein
LQNHRNNIFGNRLVRKSLRLVRKSGARLLSLKAVT